MARYERNRGMFFASWSGVSKKEVIPSVSFKTKTYTKPTRVYSYRRTSDNVFLEKHEYGSYKLELVSISSGNPFAWREYILKDGEWVEYRESVLDSKLSNEIGISLGSYSPSPPGYKLHDYVEYDYFEAYSTWEAIGKDNDSLLKELNPDTERLKNVLGETAFRHRGYQPEISVDRYYVDENRKLYSRMLKNALEEKHAENELKCFFAEAFFMAANKETMTMTGYCFVRQAYIVPQSTGGDTSGLSIPFTIVPIGAMTRKDITYYMSDNKAIIT